jgi:hypothetical protein
MRKRINAGSDPFDAFTQVQTHAMAAAASHVDVLVLDSFTSAVIAVEDDSVRAVLDRLCALHGLAAIRADLAWFQEHGHLSATSALAIRKLHDRLVAEIAGESLALVDAGKRITYQRHRYRIGKPFRGLTVAVAPTTDPDTFNVHYRHHHIRTLNTTELSTMSPNARP